MNYFALAGAILSGVIALGSLFRIITVTSGKKNWAGEWGFGFNALLVTGFGTLAAWLGSMVSA